MVSRSSEPRCGGTCDLALELLRTYALQPGDWLSACVRRRRVGLTRSGDFCSSLCRLLNSPLMQNRPLSTLLGTGTIQAVLLVCALMAGSLALQEFSFVLGPVPAAHCGAVRFTVLSLRNGSRPTSATGRQGRNERAAFGLLLNGCEVPTAPFPDDTERALFTNSSLDRPDHWQYLSGPVGFNGISITTAEHGDVSGDPAAFLVECASESRLHEFEAVAASSECGWFPGGAISVGLQEALGEVPPVQMPAGRGERVTLDYSALRCSQPVFWRATALLLLALTLGSTATLAFVISRFELLELPEPVQVLSVGMSTSSLFAIASCLTSWQAYRLEVWNHTGLILFLSSCLWGERCLNFRIAMFSLYLGVARCFWRPATLHLGTRVEPFACVLVGVAVIAEVLRRWIVRSQVQMVREDQARLTDVWQRLTAERHRLEALGQVAGLVVRLQRSLSGCGRDHVGGSGHVRHTCAVQGSSGKIEHLPVVCLDQLYFQAAVVAPLFLAKMQQWASVAGGVAVWEEDTAGADAPARGAWAPLLDPELGKTLAIYQYEGDSSRVVNIVHGSVVLEGAEGQQRCLQEMQADPGVEIVGVSDRQLVGHGPHDDYCKPCVRVWVKVTMAAAHDLRVADHVCQLDLVLQELWAFFDAPTKRRYQRFRRCVADSVNQKKKDSVWQPGARSPHATWRRWGWSMPGGVRVRPLTHEGGAGGGRGGGRDVLAAKGSAENVGSMMEKGASPLDSGWGNGVGRGEGDEDEQGLEVTGQTHAAVDACTPVKKAVLEEFFGVFPQSAHAPRAHACCACDDAACHGCGSSRPSSRGGFCATCASVQGCMLPKQMHEQLVRHHVLIVNSYLAASLDDRLRHILALLRPLADPATRGAGVGGDQADSVESPSSRVRLQSHDSKATSDADGSSGMPLQFSPEIRELLQHKCSHPGHHLRRHLSDLSVGAKSATWQSILFSSCPITFAYTKPQIRGLIGATGVGIFLQLIVPSFTHLGGKSRFAEILDQNSVQSPLFRLQAKELRGGKHLPTSDMRIGDVTLLKDGCRLPAEGTLQTKQGASIYLAHPDGLPISANGFAFRTAESGDPDFDPVILSWSFCADGGAARPSDCAEDAWLVAGSTQCFFTMHQVRCLPVTGRAFDTARERGTEHVFDLRVPRSFIFLTLCHLMRPCMPLAAVIISIGYLAPLRLFHSVCSKELCTRALLYSKETC